MESLRAGGRAFGPQVIPAHAAAAAVFLAIGRMIRWKPYRKYRGSLTESADSAVVRKRSD